MLLTEIGAIGSSELAARWAQDAVRRKNSLTAADAKLVGDAFEGRLSELAASEGRRASTVYRRTPGHNASCPTAALR
jgi:hypothetical protein